MNLQLFPYELKGNFNLREPKSKDASLIYFVIRINNKQLKLSTGVKCNPSQWDKIKQEAVINNNITRLDRHNNKIVNDKLSQIKFRFERFILYICDNFNGCYIDEDKLKSFIYGKDNKMKKNKMINIFTYLNQCIVTDTIEEGSKTTYKAVIDKFERFVKAENITLNSFNDINKNIIIKYQTYLRQLTGQKSVDGKLSVNRINTLIRTLLQRLDSYAVKNDMMSKTQLDTLKTYKELKSKVKSGESQIALRDDEVYRLYQYKTINSTDEDIKNLFILNCVTGQRISDTDKIDDNVNIINNVTTIQLKQKKSGSCIDVPILFELAKEILNKYPNGLPSISNMIMNKEIKRIAKEAGIGTDKKVVARQSGEKTNADTKSVFRYELIRTHTGRATFITMLSLRGKTSRFIKDYSGHRDMRMVEHYSKTSASERQYFEETKRKYPEMILKMIGEGNVTPKIKHNVNEKKEIEDKIINEDKSSLSITFDDIKKDIIKGYELEQENKRKNEEINNLNNIIAIEEQRNESLSNQFNNLKQKVEFGLSNKEIQAMYDEEKDMNDHLDLNNADAEREDFDEI